MAGIDEASAHQERIDGRRLSRQASAILPTIRQVDRYLRCVPAPPVTLVEVHPAVSFVGWNGTAMSHYKKSRAGREASVRR